MSGYFNFATRCKVHDLKLTYNESAESREDVEAEWRDLRTALSSAADEHFGPRPKGIQPELQSRETATVVKRR